MKNSVNNYIPKLGFKCFQETILFTGLRNILIFEEKHESLYYDTKKNTSPEVGEGVRRT